MARHSTEFTRDRSITTRHLELTSVAFPILGTQHGGLDEATVIGLMSKYLYRCDLDVEIYRHDPKAKDELIDRFRERFAQKPTAALAREIGIKNRQATALYEALKRANTLGQLASFRGVGEQTLSRAFSAMRNGPATQPRLF